MPIIDKFANMLYEINTTNIILHIIQTYHGRPDNYICKSFYTNTSGFWNFVFDAVIELKKEFNNQIANEYGDCTPDQINKAKVMIEKVQEIEASLYNSGLLSGDTRTHVGGWP